jgi:mono/diheme cytochrome c family protein
LALAALVATLVTFGCSDGAETSQSGPEVDAAAVEGLGAEVYARNCASCHGADLRGTDRGPSQLSIVYEPNHHPDEAYRSAIANGTPQHHWPFGDMPPIAGLNDEEVEAVIAFIRTEQERYGFEQ